MERKTRAYGRSCVTQAARPRPPGTAASWAVWCTSLTAPRPLAALGTARIRGQARCQPALSCGGAQLLALQRSPSAPRAARAQAGNKSALAYHAGLGVPGYTGFIPSWASQPICTKCSRARAGAPSAGAPRRLCARPLAAVRHSAAQTQQTRRRRARRARARAAGRAGRAHGVGVHGSIPAAAPWHAAGPRPAPAAGGGPARAAALHRAQHVPGGDAARRARRAAPAAQRGRVRRLPAAVRACAWLCTRRMLALVRCALTERSSGSLWGPGGVCDFCLWLLSVLMLGSAGLRRPATQCRGRVVCARGAGALPAARLRARPAGVRAHRRHPPVCLARQERMMPAHAPPMRDRELPLFWH